MPQGKRKVNQPIATFMLYSVAFSDFAPEGCIDADSKQQNVTQPFSEGCHVQAALRRARKHRTTPFCTFLHTSAQALRRKGLFWRIHTPFRQPCSPCDAQKRRTFPLGQRNSENGRRNFRNEFLHYIKVYSVPAEACSAMLFQFLAMQTFAAFSQAVSYAGLYATFARPSGSRPMLHLYKK